MDRFLKKRPAPEEDNSTQTPVAKKAKAAVKFRQAYQKEFEFIKPSKKGDHFAYCGPCNVDISISSGGKDDIRKHVKSQKHVTSMKESSSNKLMSDFLPKEGDNSVIKAEVLWTKFVIEKNLPLTTSDNFGALLRDMCPDSEIAKKFGCGRTKTAAIATCIAKTATEELAIAMRKYPFSLGTDGSNDHHAKLYPVVVIIQDDTEGISTNLLSIPELKDASTALNIKDLIIGELSKHKIPLGNCLSFISDNANVMIGKKGGVSTLLKKEQPNLLTLGCGCHLINLAAKKAVSVLPVKVDELLTDIYYFFHHSDKRLSDFNSVQMLYNDEIRKILKHCPTRWLCLTTSLQRVVELWQPLTEYFKKVKEQENEKDRKKIRKDNTSKEEKIIDSWFQKPDKPEASSSKSQEPPSSGRLDRILDVLNSRRALAYCSFILWIMPTFDHYNRVLQKEEPQIYKLKNLYLALYRDILRKLVKPEMISTCKNILDINFEDPKMQISDKDMYVGELAQNLLTKLKSKAKDAILCSVRQFYVTSLTYIREKFPLQDEVLKHAEFVNIEERQAASFSSVAYFMRKLPGMTCSMDCLQEEFSNFQCAELPPVLQNETRCDKQWNILLHYTNPLDKSRPYQNLARLALSVLTIPHSNAACERIFSLVRKNRTESRSSMSTETLSTLLVSKVRATLRPASKPALSAEFLRRCKQATADSLRLEKN